jgi:molybdopterin biosynthesis enzyme
MNKQTLLLGLGALGIVGLFLLPSSSASAATSGEAFVREMLAKVSYRKLAIAVASMDMVEPVDGSNGPRLIDWVRGEQARGRAVLIPSAYYSGSMNVSPSQLISTDDATADSLLPLGVFTKLPKGI